MRQYGFSMMELVVVLAVFAILAMLAVPNFSGKIIRDQINEALPLVDIAKPPIAASWALNKTYPADNAAAGLPAADKIVNNYISSVAVREGAIDITFGNSAHAQIKGQILTIRAAVVEEAQVVPVTWVCGHAAAPGNMTMKAENKTSVPAGHLPLKCRTG